MPAVVRAIKVGLLVPSRSKERGLRSLGERYVGAVNHCRDVVEYWDGFRDDPLTRGNLHKVVYTTLRGRFCLPAQLAVDAITDAWMGRKDYCARVRGIACAFNIPRSGSLGDTGRGNPIVRIRADGARLAIPIEKNGAWDRLKALLDDDWECSQFRVSLRNGKWSATFVVRREVLTFPAEHTMLGVDVGSRCLAAVSSVTDRRILGQHYLGKDVAVKQQHILHRRETLQSRADLGSRKAKRTLDRLRGYETNFDKTRSFQVAHRIVDDAVTHSMSIAIEDLNHLRDSRLNRAANRIVKRLPYHQFRAALEQVALRSGVSVVVVPARNTSRTCSRCWHIAKENRNGASFRCRKCGFCCNADRNASANIARRALSLEREEAAGISADDSAVGAQHSSDMGRVNGPERDHDGGLDSCPRHVQPPEFKPPTLVGGS